MSHTAARRRWEGRRSGEAAEPPSEARGCLPSGEHRGGLALARGIRSALLRPAAGAAAARFLWARDLEQQKEWRSRPRKVVAERDYFRVEQEGVPPEALEKTFGILEGRAAPALQRIASGDKPPEGDDLRAALQFVAMPAMRVPSGREIIDQNIARPGWEVRLLAPPVDRRQRPTRRRRRRSRCSALKHSSPAETGLVKPAASCR